MKHIVFLLGSYYPYYFAVEKCLGNVIEELEKNNRVTVVCFNSKINQLSKERYLNHDIVRVFTKTMYRRNLLEERLIKSEGTSKKFDQLRFTLHKINQVIKILCSKESIQKELVIEYVKALDEINNIDVLIPTCTPFESVIAAMEYKKKHNCVKLVPFIFDKFSMNQSLNRLKINMFIKMKHHLSLEEEMLKNSDKVIFVESWQEHLQKNFPKYNDKFCLVEHPLIKPFNVAKVDDFFDNTKVNIIYAGLLSKIVRSPDYVLRLFSSILKKHKNIMLHFYVVGNAVHLVNEYSKQFPDQIINHGWVKTDIVHQAMVNSSYLLSIGANDITQMSSKIFEYMSCCKPIIHTCVDKKDPANAILAKYPLSIYLEQKDSKMEENVQRLEAFLMESNLCKVDFAKIEKIFFNALPKYSADIIDKI